jgi:hypothetical protein
MRASRPAAQIYTNDRSHLADTLGRETSHRSATDSQTTRESPAPSTAVSQTSGIAREPTRTLLDHDIGMSR